MVPRKVDMSQNVRWYMPHDDGRKSRCRLVTMMTKRSSHMPTLTTIEMTNRSGDVVAHRPEPEQLRDEDVAVHQHPVHGASRAP